MCSVLPDKKFCMKCQHGKTMETSHEWLQTHCELDDEWHSPFSYACKQFTPRIKEDDDDDTKIET